MSEIEEVVYEEMHLMTMHRKIKMSDVSTAMAEMLTLTGKFVSENGITSAGPPLAVYHEWSESYVIMDVGHPIVEKKDGDGDVNYSTIPKSKVLKIVHYGDYADLPLTYQKVFNYMKENGINAQVHLGNSISLILERLQINQNGKLMYIIQ